MATTLFTGAEVEKAAAAAGKVGASRRGGNRLEAARKRAEADQKRQRQQEGQIICHNLITVMEDVKAGTYAGELTPQTFAARLKKLDGRQLGAIVTHFGLKVPAAKKGVKVDPDTRKRATILDLFIRGGKTYRELCDGWLAAPGSAVDIAWSKFFKYATDGKAYTVEELKELCQARQLYYSGSGVKCAERLARFLANGGKAEPADLSKARAVTAKKPKKAAPTPEEMLAAYLTANPTATEEQGKEAVRTFLLMQAFEKQLKAQKAAAAKVTFTA